MDLHRPGDDQRVSKKGKSKKGFVILLSLLFVGLASFLLYFYKKAPPPKPPEVSLEDQRNTITGSLEKGQTLSEALLKQQVPRELVPVILEELRPLYDFRKSRPGSSYRLVINGKGELVHFLYESSPVDIYEIKREGSLKAFKQEVVLEKREALVAGEIDSSLFESIEGKGEQAQLAMDFVDVFVWDIDFHKQSRPGDRFRILVEKLYKGDQFVKYGRILAAQYQGDSKTFTGIYFQGVKGRGGYYSPEGDSLRKTFLRAPLKFTRVTSGYSKSRLHPILGGYRPHLAIDYAAPFGTPVWAVADGVVSFAGWTGANGNSITVRHIRGYSSMYNHLSRFAKGIKVGGRVRQKQIIGYVGTTGLSTGPHLDYRVMRGRRSLNPQKQVFIPGYPIAKAERGRFLQLRDGLLKRLEAGV
ncbi:MAG: M23 family metallopeptidase [candidate division NC10 bacterium]|nr:M23 family metallopeptidase [candidate division NC10 bacterium]